MSTATISNQFTWHPFAKLYDPDNEPREIERTVGAVPMTIQKIDFPAFRRKLLKRNPHCFYCGKFVGRQSSDLDHVIPQSRGGTHSPSNLVLSCIPCNRDKAADTPVEWLERTREELKHLRRLSARLAAVIEDNDLDELEALPKPVNVPREKPKPSCPEVVEHKGADPTLDRSAFDLSRPIFSIVRTIDKKQFVSRLRATDVAHYLEAVGTDPDREIAIMCEQFWHPKAATIQTEGSEASCPQ